MIDRSVISVACVAALASFTSSIAAQDIHQGDIALGIDVDRLAVGDGSTDQVSGALLWDECTFGVELDFNARTTNPGFDTEVGAFSPSSAIAYGVP